jgi:hypothetical protein
MATRRERVVLELEDQFTSRMARAAAATAVLNKELDSLSKESVRTQRSFSDVDRSTTSFGRNADKSGAQIDRLSGRLRVLTDVATLIGPAFIPVAGLAVPAVAGLASQFGFAALAAGTAMLAFNGVGDALTKVNKAAIDPTTANLKNANLAMEKLSPAARQFIDELRSLIPAAKDLQSVAAEGLFPGVSEGLDALNHALPRVEAIVSAVSKELGSIAADTGASLASDRWAPFLEFLATEAPAALRDMSDAAGNVVHALAELWMAFEPLNNDFSNWLVDATADLDRWATGLSKTQGFVEFVAFIEEHGPQVAATFAAIGDAVIQVVDAAAPLSGPVLQGIESLAKALAALADSDIGTPLFTAAAALALFNRTMAITGSLQKATFGGAALTSLKGYGASLRGVGADLKAYNAVQNTAAGRARATAAEMDAQAAASARLKGNLAAIGKGGALLGGLAIAGTGAADSIGLTNTASLALAGTIVGPWGTAIGGAAGLLLDAKDATDGLAKSLGSVDDVIATGNLQALSEKLTELQKQRDDVNNVTGFGDFFSDRLNKARHAGAFSSNVNKDIDAQIRKIQDAMKGATDAAASSAQATDAYGRTIGKVGDTSTDTAAKIDGLVSAMQDQRKEAVSAFDAETRYRQALKAAQAQAVKSSAGIKGSSDEALKNRDIIDGLASAWNSQSDAVKNNEARFKAAKRAFIETAVGMGVPIEQAKRLAKAMLEIPKSKVIGVKFDSINALNAIARIKRELHNIPKSVRTDYFVVQTNAFNKRAQGGRDGDPNTPFASGGWTGPGSKWQPAGIVHADEFVFSAEATRGHVAELDALHRQLRGYADGGLVRRTAPAVSAAGLGAGTLNLSRGDIQQLASAMAAIQPMYGPVSLQPHNYSEFTRQMEQDRRLAGIGGPPRG